jgi:CheY-specific phosphatase CheX
VTEQSIDGALAESVQEVLEKMFFVDSLGRAEAGAQPSGIAAELMFDGDPPGSFRLELDVPAARSAAADFLGEDAEELSTEQLNEVVCELANMICGSVLSRIESKATIRLSKPMIVSAAEQPQGPAGASFQAALGSGLLRAEIRMERPVCLGIDEYES